MSRRLITALSLTTLALTSACLRRDVAAEEPTTKISFETVVAQPAIDKVDLLVMVDNSASMADKQRILGAAVPDLLRGLVQPKCVDKKTRAPTGTLADPLKPAAEQCPAGTEPAFRPITDMHIGVISSSLGGMGSTTDCLRGGTGHNDDQGHLIARGAPAGVAQAGDLHFLAWYPDVEKNQDKQRHPEPPVPATKSLSTLESAFKDLVVGVGQDGCGFEAQLESVYRFLVQPDPWTQIQVGGDGRASYGPADQVDVELLRQRAAFLRPDSLVAVIMLTDEDDSSVDPLSFDGSAWRFGERTALPRPTGACASDPASPSCTSCVFAPNDAACVANRVYDADEDSINVRFHAMKRRYGVDPQFPLSRYVDGFSKNKVPRRASEHDRGSYVGKADCTNPLFAARLPSQPNEELCNLPRGPRTKDLVYFAVIGGVPNELLPQNGDSSAPNWTAILGRDPSRYDETGIDPHMIASTDPRANLAPPTAANDADPIHGREWDTMGSDLQYACIFDLYARTADGSIPPEARANKCTGETCDCDGKRLTPLCAASEPDIQLRAKAYPTRRPLTVARDLGDHAVVASLCAKQLASPDRDDYGYRPAVRAITDRFADALTASCVPRPLGRDGSDGSVPCLVLATLPEPGPDASCEALGLGIPRADVVAQLRDRVAAEEGEASRSFPVCEVPQLVVAPGESCRDEDRKQGFCYAENAPGARCSQSLLFSKRTAELVGARFTMQCITVGANP